MKSLLTALVLMPLTLCAKIAVIPYAANGWANQYDLPSISWELRQDERKDIQALLLAVDVVTLKAKRREAANQFWLNQLGVVESQWPDDKIRFVLCVNTHKYAFDDAGRYHLPRRFLSDFDAAVIDAFDAFYQTCMKQSPVILQHPELAIIKPVKPDQKSVDTPPVFVGFEDARYQMHDELLQRCVKEFNDDPNKALGCSGANKVKIPRLTCALAKAFMIEESGGNGPRAKAAWLVDPFQVNVPGDWDQAKTDLGLKKPECRNEGMLETNVRAAIAFLARKGFSPSGKAVPRTGARFSSWRTALQRYNGRRDLTETGRTFRSAYAARIIERAYNQNVFVPIAGGRK